MHARHNRLALLAPVLQERGDLHLRDSNIPGCRMHHGPVLAFAAHNRLGVNSLSLDEEQVVSRSVIVLVALAKSSWDAAPTS